MANAIDVLMEAELDAVTGGVRINNEVCIPIPVGMPPYPSFCFQLPPPPSPPKH